MELVAGGGVKISLFNGSVCHPICPLALCLQGLCTASLRVVFKALIHPTISLLQELSGMKGFFPIKSDCLFSMSEEITGLDAAKGTPPLWELSLLSEFLTSA